MRWHDYKLADTVSKTTENITLWKSEKGILEIEANTLALPIELNGESKGFVFRGKGKLLLDAIVETDRGAIGKSVEKELKKSFMMLGSPVEVQARIEPAAQEDFQRLELENQQAFVSKAESLLDEFFDRSTHNGRCIDKSGGFVFAFPSKSDRLDILITKGSKLVYAGGDRSFVSHGNKAVLTSPEGVVVSHNGKSIFVNKCHRHVH